MFLLSDIGVVNGKKVVSVLSVNKGLCERSVQAGEPKPYRVMYSVLTEDGIAHNLQKKCAIVMEMYMWYERLKPLIKKPVN